MNKIIKEEYESFLEEIKEEGFVFGKYLDEDDYEDEYCHNDIDEAKEKLVEKIREHLSVNIPGKYIVTDGFCVFVMTPERARESRISEKTIKDYLVI